MSIDAGEFAEVCEKFSNENGIGFNWLLVQAIAGTAAKLYVKERDMVKAMEMALDHHKVTRKPERSLYKQVMGAYFGKHGASAKQKAAIEAKRVEEEKREEARRRQLRKWQPEKKDQLNLFK